jgi:hypothetical protein
MRGEGGSDDLGLQRRQDRGKGVHSTAGALRSSLPDGLPEPFQHQANDRWYDSKWAMARATREAGCVEVGNETPKVAVKADSPPQRRAHDVQARLVRRSQMRNRS